MKIPCLPLAMPAHRNFREQRKRLNQRRSHLAWVATVALATLSVAVLGTPARGQGVESDLPTGVQETGKLRLPRLFQANSLAEAHVERSGSFDRLAKVALLDDLAEPTVAPPFSLRVYVAASAVQAGEQVYNFFIEPQFTVLDRGPGQPEVQLYMALNMQSR